MNNTKTTYAGVAAAVAGLPVAISVLLLLAREMGLTLSQGELRVMFWACVVGVLGSALAKVAMGFVAKDK